MAPHELPIRVAKAAANSYSPYFDSIGEGIPSLIDLRRMMKQLRVSTLVLPFFNQDSKLLRGIAENRASIGIFVDFCESAPCIDCRGNWSAFLDTRGECTARNGSKRNGGS